MIISLTIKNITIIDYMELYFHQGLNVITGETGSGKSIILKTLNFSLGKKIDKNLLKNTDENAFVITKFLIDTQEVFDFLNHNKIIMENNQLILERHIKKKQIFNYINRVKVSSIILQKLGNLLLETHGQNDDLRNICYQKELIDKYGKISTQDIKKVFYNWKKQISSLQKIQRNLQQSKLEKEYMDFTFKELDALNLQPNEEENLKEQRKNILNINKKNRLLDEISELINIIEDNISRACKILSNSNIIDFKQILDYLEKSYIEIKEASSLVSNFTTFTNNYKIDDIEERLFKLHNITRKYNKNINELMIYKEELENKLNSINLEQGKLNEIIKTIEFLEKQYYKLALQVRKKRLSIAKILEKLIQKELSDLNMPKSQLLIEIEELDKDQWNENGIDKINLKIIINPGTKLNTLSNIASGGEISRFMLALKTVLNTAPTIIFDEIDVGIGGETANSVGDKLYNLSKRTQTIVITHQQQIAIKADRHFKVEKLYDNETTSIKINQLDDVDRAKEIARMLFGNNITGKELDIAKKLLNNHIK